MTDPTTTAEAVEQANVTRYLVREMNAGRLDHADAYYAIENYARHRIVPWDAADEFTPLALADLMGGRYEQAMMRSPEFTDPVTGLHVPESDVPLAIAADRWTLESGPEFTTGSVPLFVFVPRAEP